MTRVLYLLLFPLVLSLQISADIIVDLNQYDIYARPGFDHNWLKQLPKITNETDDSWVLIPASMNGNRSVIMGNIDHQDKVAWRKLTESNNTIEHFTLVTEFSINSEQISGRDFLGLFISSIGTNWEIYLNGHLLRNEIHLSESGNIKKHRYLTNVVIPVEQRLLKTDKNILAYHIIGDPNDMSTGLYSGSPYVIDDYEKLIYERLNLESIIFSFIYLVLSFFFIFNYVQRMKGATNLYFGLICLATFIYMSARGALIQEYIEDTIILNRIEYISLFTLGAFMMYFYDLMISYKATLLTKSYSVFSGIIIVLSLGGSSIFINQLLRLWQYTLFIPISYMLFYRVFWQLKLDFIKINKQLEKSSKVLSFFKLSKTLLFNTVEGNLLIGTLFLTITVLLDVIDSLNNLNHSLKTQYGFFIFMIGNAAILVKKYVDAQKRVENMAADLEALVHDRTKSLEDSNSKLVDARNEADDANKAKGEFLSTMSHELRTPMNGVIGMTQLLEDTQLTDEQKEYVTTISRSGDNLLEVINDILDFSKLDADMVTIESIEFDLERTTQESLIQYVGNQTNKGIESIFDYHPDCPRFFLGDPSRLRQVLANLVGNATKFTNEGYIRLSVSRIINNQRYNIRIEIEDTGIGLKPSAIEHLFDEFTQADATTTREYGGTGLGLAITKKLLGLMDGDIGVDSVHGEGATFWINIKLPEIEAPKPIITQPLMGASILYVDENINNQTIFKRMLKHMGADVTIAQDPTQVYDLLTKNMTESIQYKIVIIDHNLKDAYTNDIAKIIRADNRLNDLKLLLFSSMGKKGDANIFSKMGFNAYLNKPCRYDILHRMLSALLNQNPHQGIITQNSLKDTLQLESVEGKSAGDGANILVAEDILTNQIIAQKLLLSIGANVDVVDNGQKAIDACNKNKYSLILMDCRMPVIDGYNATKAIRAMANDNSKIPIIALTANASNDDRMLCKQSGMDDVITKPFKRSDISNCLLKWLPK